MVILGNRTNRVPSAGDGVSKLLTDLFPTVGYLPTVAMTGNGDLLIDSDEGASETATTSMECSRRAHSPLLTQGEYGPPMSRNWIDSNLNHFMNID